MFVNSNNGTFYLISIFKALHNTNSFPVIRLTVQTHIGNGFYPDSPHPHAGRAHWLPHCPPPDIADHSFQRAVNLSNDINLFPNMLIQ